MEFKKAQEHVAEIGMEGKWNGNTRRGKGHELLRGRVTLDGGIQKGNTCCWQSLMQADQGVLGGHYWLPKP